MSVYFAQRRKNGLIKIGYSRSVPNRMSALGAKLIGAVHGNRSTEIKIHERFAHLRVRGEWFRPTKELLDHIQQEAQNHKPDQESIQAAIRIPDSLLERIDKLAERISKDSFPLTRADVHRRALEMGMAQLEQGEKKLKKR